MTDRHSERRRLARMGRGLETENVAAQVEYALALAQRDAAILADCGWLPEDTRELSRLGRRLGELVREHEERLGRRRAAAGAATELLWHGKRWRLKALAIARNGLEGRARERVELLSRPTYSDPGLLAEVIDGLLRALEAEREALAPRGADAAFLAEGERILAGLRALGHGDVTGERYLGLSQEERELAEAIDELCGRIWEMLKRLNHAGRAANLLAGRRQRAAEYNLDLLAGRATGQGP